jgi:putative pyruvate formate lyase activating enzyme
MSHYPTYVNMLENGSLQRRAEQLMEKLRKCELCPHQCRVNRMERDAGFCRAGKEAEISGYGPHFGEEPPLVGRFGSGTVFFCHCTLGCVFCQNWDISHGEGDKVSPAKLADIMLELQQQKCHNINLVSPSHYVSQIVAAVAIAAARGLRLPIVYNSSGYESLETLQHLEGIVDIYMPDFKYADPAVGQRLSKVKEYWQIAKDAVKEMHRQVGDLTVDKHGIALKGLIIRHLVLPGKLAGTEKVMHFIAEEISPLSYINIMDQYHPEFQACNFPELNRRINRTEFREAIDIAKRASRQFRFAHEERVLYF